MSINLIFIYHTEIFNQTRQKIRVNGKYFPVKTNIYKMK